MTCDLYKWRALCQLSVAIDEQGWQHQGQWRIGMELFRKKVEEAAAFIRSCVEPPPPVGSHRRNGIGRGCGSNRKNHFPPL